VIESARTEFEPLETSRPTAFVLAVPFASRTSGEPDKPGCVRPAIVSGWTIFGTTRA